MNEMHRWLIALMEGVSFPGVNGQLSLLWCE